MFEWGAEETQFSEKGAARLRSQHLHHVIVGDLEQFDLSAIGSRHPDVYRPDFVVAARRDVRVNRVSHDHVFGVKYRQGFFELRAIPFINVR